MNRSPQYFDAAMVKACVMDKPVEDALWQYARDNRCPRCNGPGLQPLGELKTDRGPVGILACRECEYGVYVESVAPVVKGSAEQRARDVLVRNAESLPAGDVVELETMIAENERLRSLSESQVDTLAHFGETLEAVQGVEEFGDLVLRLLKERDRSRRAISFAMCTIRSGEEMTPEAEQVFTEALGSYSPLTFTVSCLGLLTDVPDELVVGARILARELGKPVYLTRMVSQGGIVPGSGDWTITIERDGYGSEVRIDPDGSAYEQDVYT